MPSSPATADMTSEIANHLPFLRRYARALTGEQSTGDRYAAATLEAILNDPSLFQRDRSPKVSLFHAFHRIWKSTGAPVADAPQGAEGAAYGHLSRLTENTREALLLHTVEQMPFAEIADVMALSPSEAEELVDIARREMSASIAGRVLVIEDEAIIAMDITSIVTEMGHEVVGSARTRSEAVELADREQVALVLADIQLADNSSGIDAVNEILAAHGEVPVIFITAFPERLLTGERPEPAFMISKPYNEEQVRTAVGQAMFFASTETLMN